MPKKKWGPKVAATEEAQNLKTLQLQELVGNLLAHEILLQDNTEQKAIALKASKDSGRESKNEDEETLPMLAKGFKRLYKKIPIFIGYIKGSTIKR